MILAWIIYSLIFGALVTIAALAADKAASALRIPARFVWFISIAVCTLWPVAAWFARESAAPAAAPAPNIFPFTSTLEQMTAPSGNQAAAVAQGDLDLLLLVVWTLVSLVLLWRTWTASQRLKELQTNWKRGRVDGKLVRLAPRDGPAVVGTEKMDIVLPEWMLIFEPSLRALILRHEDEHRIARDPQLISIARFAAILMPWNLALHWQLRRLRLAVELDCDARVLRAHPDADRYSKLLLAVAQLRLVLPRDTALALVSSYSHLERRILAMKYNPARRSWFAAAAATLSIVVVLAVACDVGLPLTSPDAGPVEIGSESDFVGGGASGPAYFQFEVEKSARMLPGNPPPDYPDILMQAGQTGRVMVTFVIDADGSTDMSTFKVLESTNPLFSDAVKRVLPGYRFKPAQLNGRDVRMSVNFPFEFTLASRQ